MYSVGHIRDIDGSPGAIFSKYLIISNIVSWLIEFFFFQKRMIKDELLPFSLASFICFPIFKDHITFNTRSLSLILKLTRISPFLEEVLHLYSESKFNIHLFFFNKFTYAINTVEHGTLCQKS